MVSIEDVRSAADRLTGVAARTPVLRSDAFAGPVVFKCENRQVTGSFKIRGAYNCASRFSGSEIARGLIAISSGNHAQAVAKSAKLLGTTAVIAMPSDSSPMKLAATEALGAEVIAFDRFSRDRDDVLRELLAATDRTFIPPYDHPHVIAGQGTVALELLTDEPDIDVLVVPVSGGGLIAGCGIAAKGLRPALQLIGVEPSAADDTKRSLDAGRRIWIEAPVTIADGLRVQTPGEITFEINRRQIDEIVLVTDDEITAAMDFAEATLGETVEPSGAVGIAALLTGRIDVEGKQVGVVLSGGNVIGS